MIQFVEVTVVKNGLKEKRLINVNQIKQVLEYSNDVNRLKLDLIDCDGYIVIESTMKEFKIILNNINK